VDATGKPWEKTDFWVVTSDYLMNGGDKMVFFEKRSEVVQTGELFRDVLIQFAESTPVLSSNTEMRIVINP
jgi:5'-nucleotidase